MIVFNFLWDCIVISFKSFIGYGLITLIMFLIALIVRKPENKKPKYEGKPIVLQGGKENEKK